MAYRLRRIIFNIIEMTRVKPKPLKFLKDSSLPFYRVYGLEVNLMPNRQFSGYYPELIQRLCDDWGGGLSGLSCSSGDFRSALIRGNEISLGHVWAEIYLLSLDRVFAHFEGHHIHFSDETRAVMTGMAEKRIEYRVVLSFSEPFPLEFNGLENIITGYLNAIMTGKAFDINARLKNFIEHRRLPENEPY